MRSNFKYSEFLFICILHIFQTKFSKGIIDSIYYYHISTCYFFLHSKFFFSGKMVTVAYKKLAGKRKGTFYYESQDGFRYTKNKLGKAKLYLK